MWAALAVAGVNALSGFGSSSAQKKALKQQAKNAQYNATQADIRARNSIEQGRSQAEDYQRNLSAFSSSQINTLAENGIDVSEGSAIDILASTDMAGQADLDNIKYNAALESWGHQVEKTNYLNQVNSINAQMKAINPLRDAAFSLGSSFISNGGGDLLKGLLGSGSRTPASGVERVNLTLSGGTNTKYPTPWQDYKWNTLLG
ncbi:hypothetical protein [Acinetobacter puyangensis]|uniref:virion core protein, T7 gp14 family n=1 Tax=Acinetobacter puyangensis TaxID=1096779 RepID=UPI003A4E6006